MPRPLFGEELNVLESAALGPGLPTGASFLLPASTYLAGETLFALLLPSINSSYFLSHYRLSSLGPVWDPCLVAF